MKKHVYFSCLIAFIIFCLCNVAHAQNTVTFTTQGFSLDLVTDGATISNGRCVAALPDRTATFQVSLYRSSGFIQDGYVVIYSGVTGPLHRLIDDADVANSAQNTSLSNTNNRPWGRVNQSFETTNVSGIFRTRNILAGDINLYAVFFSPVLGVAKQITVSAPIKICTSSTPPPPPPPITPPPTTTLPLSDFTPCGRDISICGDQCVTKGATAATITGRVLADRGYRPDNPTSGTDYYDPEYTTWLNYLNSAAKAGTTVFASGSEFERVQWQYSFNQNNWVDISGAIRASYSPGVINQTTYYRRVSTHYRDYLIGGSRDHWYTSNVVTIRIPAATPYAVQGRYNVCGTSTVNVAVSPAPDATSYTWYCSNPNVKINGQGYYAYTSTSTSVQVTLPAGAAQGTSYTINVSATGSCGSSSLPSVFYVAVDCATPAPPNVSFISSSAGTTCQPRYDVRAGAASGATSYTATLRGNATYEGTSMTVAASPNAYYVDFPFRIAGPISGIYASVTATSAGGTSAPVSNSPQNLAGGTCGYVVASGESADALLYPNPATDQITLRGGAQETQAAFYDSQGVCRKVVSLRGQNTQTIVNLHELPAGLYHVRLSTKGKVLKATQLIVQH